MLLAGKHKRLLLFEAASKNLVCQRLSSLAYYLLGSVLSDPDDVIQFLLA